MCFEIKPLTPELAPAYLDFFDNRAFSDNNPNGPCYCTSPNMDIATEAQMVSEFGNDIKGTIRRYAVEMLIEEKIHGYLAFQNGESIGWCNAADVKSYSSWIPESSRQNPSGEVIAVVCFAITPEFRGKGVALAFLERICADAKRNCFFSS